MKILALNTSPRVNKGNTEIFLNAFLKGIKKAGGEVDVFYPRRMSIHPFDGDGKIEDDIKILKEKFMNIDTMIFATPIYSFSYTSYASVVLERLLFSFINKEVKLIDGKGHFVAELPKKQCNIILMANGSFDGDYTFKGLKGIFDGISKAVVSKDMLSCFPLKYSITIGFAPLLRDKTIFEKCGSLFENLQKAGEELVESGSISNDIYELINKPVYHYANISREDALKKHVEILREGLYKKHK